MTVPTTRAATGPVANLYAWAISLLASVFAVGSGGFAAVLLLAPQRHIGPAFRYVTAGSPDGARLWGLAFLISAAVALYGQYTHRMWPTRLAHSAASVGCVWWVLAFAAVAPADGRVAITGCVAYALIGAAHAMFAVVSPHRARFSP